MPEKILYSTSAEVTGGRDGSVKALDGSFEAKLSMPKALGGAGGEGTNPETLFASGYAACFLSALKLISSQAGVTLPAETSIIATVGIGPNGQGGFALAAELKASAPGIDKAQLEALVAKAHEVCPYSNATRNNIDVKISVA